MRMLRTSTVVLAALLAADIDFCLGCLVRGLCCCSFGFVFGCGSFVRGLMPVTAKKMLLLVTHGQVQLPLLLMITSYLSLQ